MIRPVLFSLFLLTGVCGSTQGVKRIPTDNKLADATDSLVQKSVLPFFEDSARTGLSLVVFKNGTPRFYNYGTVERGKNALPTKHTIYEIGSVSKTFTGTLLAKAILEGKIKLEDEVRTYLKAPYPNLSFDGQQVKISHLVNHTSGLPQFLPDRPELFQHSMDSIPFFLSEVHNKLTKESFMEHLHQVRMDTVPGTKTRYSNAGTQLLAFILEGVYGQSYERLLENHITGPLRMTQTFGSPDKKWAAKRAQGYSPTGKPMPYTPPILVPAGGIYSTTADLVPYIRFHLDKGNRIARLTQQPTKGDTAGYAIGLFWHMDNSEAGQRKVWHTGGTFGFSSYAVLYPDLQVSLVLLSNEMDMASQGALVAIADGIFSALPAR